MKSLNKLWTLTRNSPTRWAPTVVFSCLSWGLLVIPGLITRQIFDLLSNHRNTFPFTVGDWLIILVAVAIVRMLVNFLQMLTGTRAQLSTSAMIRTNLFGDILNHVGTRPVAMSTGEALSRIGADTDDIAQFLSDASNLVGELFFALIGFANLISISPAITLIAFVPLVVVVASAAVVTQRVQGTFRDSRESAGNVAGLIGEVFGAVQAVKLSNAELHVVKKLDALGQARKKANLSNLLLDRLIDSAFSNVAQMGTGLMLLAVAHAIREKTFTIGDFAIYSYFLGWASGITRDAGNFVVRIRRVDVSFERVEGLLQGASSDTIVQSCDVHLTGPLPSATPIAKTFDHRLETLHVRGLTYHYPNSEAGVTDIDFCLRRGTLTVITGRVGSSKTTLLRVLLGLLAKESGEIFWNGELVQDPVTFLVPPRTAYTAQVPTLFSDTIRENILMGASVDDSAVSVAIHLAVLERDLADMSDNLDTMLGRKGVRLSGGQIHRTAAARMFVRSPEIYVFDDLSSALDVETECILWDRLQANFDATYLVVSHRREAMLRADEIIVLKNGKVEDRGTLSELLDRCTELQFLWHGK